LQAHVGALEAQSAPILGARGRATAADVPEDPHRVPSPQVATRSFGPSGQCSSVGWPVKPHRIPKETSKKWEQIDPSEGGSPPASTTVVCSTRPGEEPRHPSTRQTARTALAEALGAVTAA